MKLRNKKTGEIGWLETYYGETDEKMIAVLDKKIEYHPYNSLAELNDEWEDYGEPKDFYYISADGQIKSQSINDRDFDHIKDGVENLIAIGDYFETKEEAEKAVEKLKAWKRLKDIGCRFDGWNVKTAGSEGDRLLINLYVKDCTECEGLLDLLFGGEE